MTAPDETTGSRILVVDDVQDNLDLMVEVLEDSPWSVSTARDAAGALQRAAEECFDLFLLDAQMPEMDGFELCRRLRREPDTRDIPVIFVTAERTSTASVVEGLDAGGFDYIIIKPFDQAELLARVRVMLRLRASETRLLTVQSSLDEQNHRLSAVNDRLAEACQQMLEQRVELIRKTHELERANQVKSEFLAKMSHELRTPLNAIIGFSDLMVSDRREPPAERQVQRLERIGRNGRQLLVLINDILDLSKIEADRMKLTLAPVDLAAVVRECVDLVHPLLEQKLIRVEARIPAQLPTWEGDEVRLRQIVTNLLGNAIKFTDSGNVILEVRGTDRNVCLSVCDTGIGIAPEHLPYVFEPFRQVDSSSTRRAGGTGLGLPICRRLCRLMGGTIEACSEPGVGSTFKVTLPWRAEPQELDDASTNAAALTETKRSILLCSEDPGTVDLTTAHLAEYDIDVRHADKEDLIRNLLLQKQPDGVIIDMDSRAAYGALRLVKSVDPPAPRLWLGVWTEDHQLGYALELDDYIVRRPDTTVVAADRSASHLANKVALAHAESAAVRKELQILLADLGYDRTRTVSGALEAINELSSRKVGDLFIDLDGFATGAIHLVERVRRIPEWSSVRIIGVVPSPRNDDEQEAKIGSSDEFVRRHGVATPTLLLDIAEKLMAKRAVATVGVPL